MNSYRLNDQDRADQFANWYKWSGCWVYGNRANALRVWSERGIIGLPACSAGAASLLAAWAGA
jgi:hypothetical protein